MSLLELFITAVGLSMDAFAVAICKGLGSRKVPWKSMAIVGLWFGGFQALMPLLGYFLGSAFGSYIEAADHWIAFVLLAAIGGNMIKEALTSGQECSTDTSLAFRVMLTMALATSIDALAAGVTYGLLPEVNIWAAIAFIGVITFGLSAVGVKVGSIFGCRFKAKAEFLGGAILILMGLKILLEHLGILTISLF